ncbi:MAG: hypothetical protein WA125_06070, partial [Desulfosporosinus sp.]
GIDHKTVEGALKDFDLWIEDLIESIHRKSYKPPAVRRVWIPKPGKTEKRPICSAQFLRFPPELCRYRTPTQWKTILTN